MRAHLLLSSLDLPRVDVGRLESREEELDRRHVVAVGAADHCLDAQVGEVVPSYGTGMIASGVELENSLFLELGILLR